MLSLMATMTHLSSIYMNGNFVINGDNALVYAHNGNFTINGSNDTLISANAVEVVITGNQDL